MFCVNFDEWTKHVATLVLGSRPRQGLAKVCTQGNHAFTKSSHHFINFGALNESIKYMNFLIFACAGQE